MNLKTTYILFGVLAVALGGLVLAQLFRLGPRGPGSDFVFPELHSRKNPVDEKKIDSVRIEHADSAKGATYLFTRGDQRAWQIEEPKQFRAAQFEVNNLVQHVASAAREKVDLISNLKEYELDKPRIIVTLSRGDESWTLNIGKESQGTDPYVYVTSSIRPKEPIAVKKSAIQDVFKSLNEFRDLSLVAARESEIDNLELDAPGKKGAAALVKETGESWKFTQPAGYGAADYNGDGTPHLSTEKGFKITGVRDLLRAVVDTRVEKPADFVADNVSDTELKDNYGLDKSDPATLRIVVKSSKKNAEGDSTTSTETLLIGKKVPVENQEKKDEKKDEKKSDKKQEPPKLEYYYARLENQNNVVKVPAKGVESLLAVASDPDGLRDRDLAHFDRSKVDAIQIENAEGTIHLFRTDGSWKLWRDKTSTNAEDSAVRALLDTLDEKLDGRHRIDSFPSIKPEEAGMDKNARLAVVSIWVDGLKKEEKKEDKKEEKKEDKKEDKKDGKPELKDPNTPTARFTVGKQLKDRGLVYVLREIAGEKQPALLLVKDKQGIKEGLADRVTPGPLAYLDHKIPAYSASTGSTVKLLDLTRGTETFQLKSEKTGEIETWKFSAPKEMDQRPADSFAVRDILGLGRLIALRVAAERPTDKQLEGFGLKPPQFQATITAADKDGKEEKYSYSFGKETPDKSGIFMKSDRSDLVYVIPDAILTSLQAELQDKNLFAFDVDKVRGLKITGWKNVVAGGQTLDLERKSKNSWTAKSPQGLEVEPAITESFLHMLSNLRTTKFLTGAPKPEYGLDPAKNPGLLTIEIILDGNKPPLKLTIGGPNAADKAYYATTGAGKDQAVLVPEDTFKRVLEKPVYFTKAGQ